MKSSLATSGISFAALLMLSAAGLAAAPGRLAPDKPMAKLMAIVSG